MKHLLISILLATLFISSQAQVADKATDLLFSPKQIIKTNLAGYTFLTVNAKYEINTGFNTTVGLLGGYMIPTTIELSAIGDLDGERMTYEGIIEPEGLYLNPYFRYYPKEAFKGFYVEAFGRYFNYQYLVPYEYSKDDEIIVANLDGTASAVGGGLAIGSQFPIGPRWYLDLNTGFGIASGDAHIETNDPRLDTEDFLKIKQNLDENVEDADIQIFLLGDMLNGLSTGANENAAWGDIENKLFPIVRAGISIGYAF